MAHHLSLRDALGRISPRERLVDRDDDVSCVVMMNGWGKTVRVEPTPTNPPWRIEYISI